MRGRDDALFPSPEEIGRWLAEASEDRRGRFLLMRYAAKLAAVVERGHYVDPETLQRLLTTAQECGGLPLPDKGTKGAIAHDLQAIEALPRVLAMGSGMYVQHPLETTAHLNLSSAREAKAGLAAACVNLIEEPQRVFVGDGSTFYFLLQCVSAATMAGRVLTNNLFLLQQACANLPSVRVEATGGEVLQPAFALCGKQAESSLKRFKPVVSLVSVSGIRLEGKRVLLTSQHERLMQMHRIAVDVASHSVFIVADATKLGSPHGTSFATLSDITSRGVAVDLVTNAHGRGKRTELLSRWEAEGGHVIHPPRR